MGVDKPLVLISFVLAFLVYAHLPSSSVSLFFFIVAAPMHKCGRQHTCMNYTFSIAILNEIFSLRSEVRTQVLSNRSFIKLFKLQSSSVELRFANVLLIPNSPNLSLVI